MQHLTSKTNNSTVPNTELINDLQKSSDVSYHQYHKTVSK